MTVILLRHGRSTSNTAHTLAGRSEGVDLDERGAEQAAGLVARIGELPVTAIVHSPLLRCVRTVAPLAEALRAAADRRRPAHRGRLRQLDRRARSASWSRSRCGRWCSSSPVRRCFPRARAWPRSRPVRSPRCGSVTAHLADEHGADVLWVACTHGDVIKAVLADALGVHLDGFQRITADPASMSVIRYTDLRPFVMHINHTGAQLSAGLAAKPATDAVVGGSTN